MVGVGLLVLIGLSFRPQPVEVDFAEVERGDVLVTVDEDGKTRIREKYVVSTPLAGRLLRINMDPGDPVVAGKTLLATIEPRDPDLLDARAVAQAEARVRAAESAVKKTEPMLEQARIEQSNAETQLQRVRAANVALSASELDEAEARYRAATEDLRAARYAQEIAEFELEQAQAALVRSRPRDEDRASPGRRLPSAEQSDVPDRDPAPGDDREDQGLNGWNYNISSPITGRVLRVFQESSAVVTAGMSLLELGDPSDLEVEIDVLSSDAVKIDPGARVMLEHWGGDQTLHAQVRLVEPSGFTKISTLGVEEQRVNVIVDLTDAVDARRSLGDGFRVEARIVVAEAKDVLRIPASALFRPDEGWAVFRVVEGRAVATVVEPGHQNGLEAEIKSGLAAGDQVIIHPSDQVADGVQVTSRVAR